MYNDREKIASFNLDADSARGHAILRALLGLGEGRELRILQTLAQMGSHALLIKADNLEGIHRAHTASGHSGAKLESISKRKKTTIGRALLNLRADHVHRDLAPHSRAISVQRNKLSPEARLQLPERSVDNTDTGAKLLI